MRRFIQANLPIPIAGCNDPIPQLHGGAGAAGARRGGIRPCWSSEAEGGQCPTTFSGLSKTRSEGVGGGCRSPEHGRFPCEERGGFAFQPVPSSHPELHIATWPCCRAELPPAHPLPLPPRPVLRSRDFGDQPEGLSRAPNAQCSRVVRRHQIRSSLLQQGRDRTAVAGPGHAVS